MVAKLQPGNYYLLTNRQIIKIIWHKPEINRVKYINVTTGSIYKPNSIRLYKKKLRRIIKDLGSNGTVAQILYGKTARGNE